VRIGGILRKGSARPPTDLGTLVYFGGIVLLQWFFVIITGEKSTLAAVASTLLIAALFTTRDLNGALTSSSIHLTSGWGLLGN
jgi:hypothetical protein